MYAYDQRPGTNFPKATRARIEELKKSEYGVLVGRNNCGKSYVLKTLAQELGENASYLGPARYQNFNLLGTYAPSSDRKSRRYKEFLNMWRQQSQNIDNSPLSLQQAIAELSDEARANLNEIIHILLGTKMEILYTVPKNSMSQQYISVNGHNISFTSSGFRLIATLITCFLDSSYDTFLVDEPELGISPEAQGMLADFLFDRTHRARYFPHIKTIILATHSTIFLDRISIGNNYIVSKDGDLVSLNQVDSQAEFNQIHFFLLGNRFESLYLPSAIILVEGKTDCAFIQRVLSLRFPNYQFSVINATSDNRIKEVLNVAKGLLADLQKSPYRDRIFAVVDSVHGAGLPESLASMGLPKENVVVWSANGIEHVYPPETLDAIFGSGGTIAVNGDQVSRNGISYNKNELAEKVCSRITASTPLHSEFSSKFLDHLASKVG
jgi:predicted ATP-dependent endonuclease of OLD family